MKLGNLGLLCGLLLAGPSALACYTVYDAAGRVTYQDARAPVDMRLALQEALAERFPAGSTMVFDLQAACTPVTLAQMAGPFLLAPPGSVPLLTERATAQRQNLPHTILAGDIVMVPGSAAARARLPNLTVISSDSPAPLTPGKAQAPD